MSPSEPFGRDSDATVIRPTPGGRRAATPARPPVEQTIPPAAAARGGVQPVGLPQSGINPLVTAATPLLTLATRIKGTIRAPNVDALHERIVAAIGQFEKQAGAAGIPAKQIAEARYLLSALIDDLVQNTPWGMEARWARRSMVHTFHREAVSGERFFDILEHRLRDPANHLDMLELMYLCLAMGFEGRFRIEARGSSDLTRVREKLYQAIRSLRGDFERDLSPHWPGIDSGRRPLTSYIPIWVVAAGCAAALVAMFTGYFFALNAASDTLLGRLATLPPVTNVALAAGSEPLPPDAAPAPPPDDPLVKIQGFLEPEIEQHLVEVFSSPNSVTVRLVAPTMFASGSDQVVPDYLPLLQRIGDALNDKQGQVKVVGHTDNIPIRHSLRFPSNYALSLARAEAVRAVVASKMDDPSRLTAEGRADAEPIAPNDTAEGRARNRRVEVILIRDFNSQVPPA